MARTPAEGNPVLVVRPDRDVVITIPTVDEEPFALRDPFQARMEHFGKVNGVGEDALDPFMDAAQGFFPLLVGRPVNIGAHLGGGDPCPNVESDCGGQTEAFLSR
jgi:hypothetical protein